MWGLLVPLLFAVPDDRFTPTYVGTSTTHHDSPWENTVHPHVCGDFEFLAVILRDLSGSPPRMWGLLHRLCRCTLRRRFTPTYVGTSISTNYQGFFHQVHPHVCGDFSRQYCNGSDAGGSPPRMWGLQRGRSSPTRRDRFTPTYVGTSFSIFVVITYNQVHPHVCGDFGRSAESSGHQNGSPPRMWGLLRSAGPIGPALRFTPTYVGTSGKKRSACALFAVHPHVCGDF